MEESTSKEKVLKKVRNALIDKSDNPYPNLDFESSVYNDITESLDITFAEALNKVSGNFVYCENINSFTTTFKALLKEKNLSDLFCLDTNIQEILNNASIPFLSNEEDFLKQNLGITACEYLIARLGTIMVSSKQMSGRRLNVYPEVHIVLAYASQLVPDLKQALKQVKLKYEPNYPSMITFITGPSRTADIEKTLVLGAHGPKEIYVFLVDDTI
ncbi:MAG: LUD domain-containing protein [Bacteroidota bacterium]